MTAALAALARALTAPVTVTNARQVDGPGLRYSYYGAVTDPDALAARLLAALTVDETVVEAVARAMAEGSGLPLSDREWRTAFDAEDRERFREMARAALAALTGSDHGSEVTG